MPEDVVMGVRRVRLVIVSALVALAIAALIVALPGTAQAQQPQSTSASLAVQLAKLLDEQKLDSIAVRAADDFVGALYFPGTQLLVVSATYSAPDRMTYLIAQKQYREVYIDLNSAAEAKSRFFVSDLGANGLLFKRENNQPFDTADSGGSRVDFDGEWGRAKLSEAEYTKRFQSADQRYATILQALIAALKKPS
jgi:hypothetical protein